MSACLIAGSRSIKNYKLVESIIVRATKELNKEVTEIVEGEAGGVDKLGRKYGEDHHISVIPMSANWNFLGHPNAALRRNRWNKLYDANAGFRRNEEMVQYVKSVNGFAIVIWDGVSPGTNNTCELLLKYHVPFCLATVNNIGSATYEYF
jgi:hypothetical protein